MSLLAAIASANPARPVKGPCLAALLPPRVVTPDTICRKFHPSDTDRLFRLLSTPPELEKKTPESREAFQKMILGDQQNCASYVIIRRLGLGMRDMIGLIRFDRIYSTDRKPIVFMQDKELWMNFALVLNRHSQNLGISTQVVRHFTKLVDKTLKPTGYYAIVPNVNFAAFKVLARNSFRAYDEDEERRLFVRGPDHEILLQRFLANGYNFKPEE